MIEKAQRFAAIELTQHDFQRYIPPFPVSEENLLEASREYLNQCDINLKVLHDQGYHSQQLLGVRTLMIDHLIQTVFLVVEKSIIKKHMHQGPYASVIAQGGYGRGEMNLKSDIDLIFIYPKKKGAYIENLTERILYLLWDLKLDVGYATRTVNECKKLFFEDVTIMTSLLDIRYLCGDKSFFDELDREIDQILNNKSVQDKMADLKMKEREERIQKNGKSVFVLEPNIKESHGGLRDLQLILWISKIKKIGDSFLALKKLGFISEEELNLLHTARNFFWRIRNELHFITKRKKDVLNFDHQEKIAHSLGFENDENGILGVEKFMQTYYQLAYQVSAITTSLIRNLTRKKSFVSQFMYRLKTKNIDETFRIEDECVAVKSRQALNRDPLNMMRVFKCVQEYGLPLHPDTLDHIRFYTPKLVDDKLRNHPQAVHMFRGILNKYENLGLVLEAMHESHFLDEWMPEFQKLRCRVQHDVYHFYTIDTHSIYAVNELSKLVRGDYDDEFIFYKEILKQIIKPEMLTLGLFLHDIGKGEGGNHEIKGANISKTITKRLNYTPEECETIEFLIQSHLMMPHLSQRRDLEDIELINKFSKSMGSIDRLNMLLLLTWGDIRAVGPKAWTDWKGALLQKLYEKSKEVITTGEYSQEKTEQRIERVKQSVLEIVRGIYSQEDVQGYLDIMPSRYFFANEDEDIQKHYKLYEKAKSENIAISLETEDNLSELLVYTLNKPRIFSEIAGVMRLCSLNIVRADVFQTKSGHVLLNFWITDQEGKALKVKSVDTKVKNLLVRVLRQEDDIEKLIASRNVPDYLVKKPLQKAKEKVVVDNNISTYYTVIEVYAHDRLGLLYDLSKVLNDMGCYVDVSKISTKVDQVADVFYVQDIFGHKIISRPKLKDIKEGLQNIIKQNHEENIQSVSVSPNV